MPDTRKKSRSSANQSQTRSKKATTTRKQPPKRKKKNPVKNFFSSLLIVLLIVAGVALAFNSQIKNALIKSNTEKYDISHYTRADIEKNQNVEATFDFNQVTSITSEDVIKAQFSDLDSVVIGGIALPDVGINLPIFKGVAYDALFFGAGTTSAEQQLGSGNYGLASHNPIDKNLLFGPLHQSQLGQLIYLTDLAQVYTYEISRIWIVPPSDGSVLAVIPGESVVTLVTCSDDAGSERLIVQGRLQSTVAIEDAPDNVAQAFNLNKNSY
ncbi:sortase A [Enterococcus sp. PF1-24]|uniref:class A sortase n=1 Tax=unclassified Enterococcus TaxID=2608891 RepID=UPI002473B64E|nr:MULTISPECIES: class A sortase [unclassified Enterococcus]MDH6365682.1 sortase A [Enterococcus sp. PFB1-1]MDH6402792.1 sortase A [Enterococcus sp. PF1-24]